MKILLLYPSHKRSLFDKDFLKLTDGKATAISDSQDFPVSFGYIASQLLEKNHDIKIIDAHSLNLSFDQVKREVLNFKPDVLGIDSDFRWECPIPSTHHVQLLLQNLKELNLNFKTILMGPQGAIHPEEELRNLDIYVLIRGESEFIFPNVIEKFDNLKNVNGINYKEDGEIIHNVDEELGDVNKLPYPAYDLLDLKNYYLEPMGELWSYPRMQNFQVVSSKGCPYQCVFCFKKNYGNVFRYRKINKVIAEIEMLKERGTRFIQFTDASFALNKNRALDICSEIEQKKIDINWSCMLRPEHVEEGVIREMANAGCRFVMVGTESGSDKILENAKKGYTVKDIRLAVETCKKYVNTAVFICKFLPGETKETLKETLNLLKELNPFFIGQVMATPIPGTELFRMGVEEGTLKNDSWEEILLKAGMIGNPYSREEIDKVSEWFSLEIAKFRIRSWRNVKSYLGKIITLQKPTKYIKFGYKILKNRLIK